MIVLDADSVMEGETLVEMVRRMDADRQLGILQVPPTPVNRLSMFARLQQFASRLYSDIFIADSGEDDLTEMKMHKLLYFAQKIHYKN